MRRNNIIMLTVLVILYLGTTWILGGLYGPSYNNLDGKNNWLPDGNGGWVENGKPTTPSPDQPSVIIPQIAPYLPIFIPSFLLALFLFTPLRTILDGKPSAKKPEDESDPVSEGDTDSQEESA